MNVISFTEAINERTGFILSPGCKTEIKGYFTELRVDRKTIPDGWYAYDIRTTDSSNGYATIEPNVLVNHGGTFLTKTEIPFRNKKYRCLSGRGGYTFEDDMEKIEKELDK